MQETSLTPKIYKSKAKKLAHAFYPL